MKPGRMCCASRRRRFNQDYADDDDDDTGDADDDLPAGLKARIYLGNCCALTRQFDGQPPQDSIAPWP